MKNISFSLTEPQFIDGSKTVTRRLGWRDLTPGTLLCAIRKGMGLKKGEKVHRLGVIVVVDVRREPLLFITDEDVVREGFPEMTAKTFIDFFKEKMRCSFYTEVARIEYRHLAVCERASGCEIPNECAWAEACLPDPDRR